MKPLVSIIMPTKDRLTYLNRAVTSVLSQTVPNFELILLDDSETKPAVKEISELDDRIRYVDRGGINVAQARSLGVRLAEGKFVALLDSDDYWERDKLEEHLRVWEHEQIGLSWDRWVNVTNGKMIPSEQPFQDGRVTPRKMAQKLYWTNFIHSSAGFTLCKLARQVNFDWSLFSDWALYALVAQFHDCFFIDRVLTYRDISAPTRVSDTEGMALQREAGLSLRKYLVRTRPLTYLPPHLRGKLGMLRGRIFLRRSAS